MTQIDYTIQRRKKILFVDVPGIGQTFAPFLHRWGYEVVTAYHPDVNSILELVSREKIDLLVAAKELTLKGPSLSDDWKRGDAMEVDREFGIELLSELRLKNSDLPVILLTTDDLNKSEWIRRDDGKLDWVMTEKVSRNVDNPYDELKKGIEEFLGPGLAIHQWVKVLIIDDETGSCSQMKDMLSSEGYHVDYVAKADEALEKLRRCEYNLFLVGVDPRGNVAGIEVIRNFKGKQKRPKILVVSGTPYDELNRLLEKEGVKHLVARCLDKANYSIPGRLADRVMFVMEQYSE